jgi:alanine racemase
MKTWIELNRAHLRHNLALFAELSNRPLMFIVKANAYGHGLKEVIEMTADMPQIGYYAVDSYAEAAIAKPLAAGKKIIVIGWEDHAEIIEMIRQNIEMIIPSVDYFNQVIQLAAALQKKALLHLKLETGTHRLGMSHTELMNIANAPQSANFQICGIYSHFANIEDTTDHSYADQQLAAYHQLVAKLNNESIIRHFSCSASTLLFPETYFDMVRIGISAYGYWPSKPTKVSYREQGKTSIELKPVLSWFTKAAQVKDTRKGEYIGYGLSYRTFSDSKMMVIPVGYYDGYDRRLSNCGNVMVKGVKAPLRGRICMDMAMVDVTHIQDIQTGDEVILLGANGKERITAEDTADLCGTIHYEFLSRLNPAIPRFIV